MHPPRPSSRYNAGSSAANSGYYGSHAPHMGQQMQYYVPPSGPSLRTSGPSLRTTAQPSAIPVDFTKKAMQQASLTTLSNAARNLGIPPPLYDIQRVGGADHNPIFECTISWNNDSMHETAQAGSKMAVKRCAAVAMIQRLTQAGVDIYGEKNSNNSSQQGPKYQPQLAVPSHQQQSYQGLKSPYYVDPGTSNLAPHNVQHQVARGGLNYPARNIGGSAITRPTTVKADPYANNSYNFNSLNPYSSADNRNGYGIGNGRQPSGRNVPRSYERNQANRQNHPVRRPLLSQPNPGLPSVDGSRHSRPNPQESRQHGPPNPRIADGSRHFRPNPQESRQHGPPNPRIAASYASSTPPSQGMRQYPSRIPKPEPGTVGTHVRYTSGGSKKLRNNQDLPSIPKKPEGSSNGITLGASKDPRIRRKAVFGGTPTPSLPLETDTTKNRDFNKNAPSKDAKEHPKTAQQNLYQAAILGPALAKSTANAAPKNVPSPSVAQTPKKYATDPARMNAPPSLQRPAHPSAPSPKNSITDSAPVNAAVSIRPATSCCVASNPKKGIADSAPRPSFRPSTSPPVAPTYKKNVTDSAPEKMASSLQSAVSSPVSGSTSKKDIAAPARKNVSFAAQLPTFSVVSVPKKLISSHPPSSLAVSGRTEAKPPAKSIPSPPSRATFPAIVHVSPPTSTMASKVAPESEKMKNIDPQFSEKFSSVATAVQPSKEKALSASTTPAQIDSKPKNGTTDRSVAPLGSPSSAPNSSVTKSTVQPANNEGDCITINGANVTDLRDDKMGVSTVKKERLTVETEQPTEISTPIKDVSMKDVEAPPVKKTAVNGIEVLEEKPFIEVPPRKARAWEITPPPRRSNRNRTATKKLAEEIDPDATIIRTRRTRSMKDNKRPAEVISEETAVDNTPPAKAARVARVEKEDLATADLMTIFETESTSSKSGKSGDAGLKNNETSAETGKVAGVSLRNPQTKEKGLIRSELPAKKRPRFNRIMLWIYANGDELSVYHLLRNAVWSAEPFLDISVHIYGTSIEIPTPRIPQNARKCVVHEMEHDVPKNSVYSIVAVKAALQAAELRRMREKGDPTIDFALSRVLVVSSSDCIIAATEYMTLVKADAIDSYIKDIAYEYRQKHNVA